MFRRAGRLRDRVLRRGCAGNTAVDACWTGGAGSEGTTIAGITRGHKKRRFRRRTWPLRSGIAGSGLKGFPKQWWPLTTCSPKGRATLGGPGACSPGKFCKLRYWNGKSDHFSTTTTTKKQMSLLQLFAPLYQNMVTFWLWKPSSQRNKKISWLSNRRLALICEGKRKSCWLKFMMIINFNQRLFRSSSQNNDNIRSPLTCMIIKKKKKDRACQWRKSTSTKTSMSSGARYPCTATQWARVAKNVLLKSTQPKIFKNMRAWTPILFSKVQTEKHVFNLIWQERVRWEHPSLAPKFCVLRNASFLIPYLSGFSIESIAKCSRHSLECNYLTILDATESQNFDPLLVSNVFSASTGAIALRVLKAKHATGKIFSWRSSSWKPRSKSMLGWKVITLWVRAGAFGAFLDKCWSFLVPGKATNRPLSSWLLRSLMPL